MTSIVQVNLNLNQAVSDYFYNYIVQNADNVGAFGLNPPALTKANIQPINTVVYIPPANAQTIEILSDGAYFLPVGLTDFDDNTIEQISELIFLDVSQNKTVYIYSFFQQIVNIRISYD